MMALDKVQEIVLFPISWQSFEFSKNCSKTSKDIEKSLESVAFYWISLWHSNTPIVHNFRKHLNIILTFSIFNEHFPKLLAIPKFLKTLHARNCTLRDKLKYNCNVNFSFQHLAKIFLKISLFPIEIQIYYFQILHC